jgi:hypothetical protein
VVTDTRTGQIVSCLHLVSQTWSYGGVAIPMGQPELIGTRTEHRGHGLVRTQFEIVHGWSAEQRHQLLAIAGIPWFYRQFGYEMAIERGGGPLVRLDALLPLPAPPPGWRVRAAGLGDIAFLTGAGAAAAARSLVSVPRDAALCAMSSRASVATARPGARSAFSSGTVSRSATSCMPSRCSARIWPSWASRSSRGCRGARPGSRPCTT